MLSIKNKLDINLRYYLSNNYYKKYRILIKYKNLSNNIEKKIISYKGTLLYTLKYSNIICAELTSASILKLIEYPEVTFVTFDDYLFLCGNSLLYSNNINSYKNPPYNFSGTNIGIAVIDTGVYPHKDLTSNCNKIKEFHDLINNIEYPYDDNGHGTAIAGIISGSGLASQGKYKGIAAGANLYYYKSFDKLGKGFASDILSAMEDIIQNSKTKNIKIICLPFELLSFNTFIIEAFKNTFDEAAKEKLIVIVPSGSNSNPSNTIRGIATIDSCITVAGIENIYNNTLYPYSSSGPLGKKLKPNIAAACFQIISLNCDIAYISQKDGIKLYPPKLKSSYKAYSGTSLACAYIAGVCALLLEKRPELSINDIISLFNLCSTQNEYNKHDVGAGILNLEKLLS